MNLFQKLRQTPKRFVALAALIVAGGATAAVMAWGPSRTTYTIEHPATKVTFNSITNNPIDGDERNFARAVETSDPVGDVANVEAGKTYTIRMVVHNNAADNLNLKAINTRALVGMPSKSGTTLSITNYVSADNADPKQVWDEVVFKSSKAFSLVYVPGSARIYNNGYAAGGSGKPLTDSLVTSAGSKLGYAQAGDGIIPGCFKYLSYVEYKVKPQFAPSSEFTMDKQVRKHSTTTGGWVENYAAKPGEVVDYIIRYKNTGEVTMNDVVIKDTLPAGMSYVAGSTVMANSNYPNGVQVSDNVTKGGINIGSYTSGANAWVRFSAKVNDNEKLPVCGTNTLKNVGKVETDYGTKNDDAVVTVPKECEEKTIEVCRLSDKKYPVTIKESEFDSELYSKDRSDCDTPEEIPSTGPAALFASIVGSSALGYGAYTYAASRRALKNARK